LTIKFSVLDKLPSRREQKRENTTTLEIYESSHFKAFVTCDELSFLFNKRKKTSFSVGG
jgi:hypothetical protein